MLNNGVDNHWFLFYLIIDAEPDSVKVIHATVKLWLLVISSFIPFLRRVVSNRVENFFNDSYFKIIT